jgi:hypothetical protein
MASLEVLLAEALERVKAMTPEQREEMWRKQRESYVRAELNWPKPKFAWVNGVKVYASMDDYHNG